MLKPVVIIAATAFSISLFTNTAAAQSAPGVDWRQHHQSKRIYHGVRTGDLSFRETGQLIRGQVRIRRQEHRYRSDGVLTRSERARLHRSLNRQNRRIYRKKHN